MTSPYRNRPRKSFWKTGVVAAESALADLYCKRIAIRTSDKIATAGSCFAQHIANHLVRHGYNVIDAEPPPMGLARDVAQRFGYLLYSARYGNIYTARQMLQLAQESFGVFDPADVVWSKGGRYFDALRPSVEPTGLESPEEVIAHRADHVRRVRRVLKTADLLMFTLGLTEAWVHRTSGTVYPTAPETIAGQYSADIYEFKNFSYEEVVGDLIALRRLLKERNPRLRFLFTVSPVPLNATASDQHVLVATTYSKAVLRAAAGALYQRFDDVDYFPSYEIIASPFLGSFYDSDLRTVTSRGVETVMSVFFAAHTAAEHPASTPFPLPHAPAAPGEERRKREEDLVCEEMLLEAFAR